MIALLPLARSALSLIGGWRALGFALCASLLWLSAHRWQNRAEAAQASLKLAQADVAVLEAQRDAANSLAMDYEARAKRAVADAAKAQEAAEAANAAAARKWREILAKEKAWATTPVPDAVWEGIGK